MKEKMGGGGGGGVETGANLCKDAASPERYKKAMKGGKCPAIVDTRQPQSCVTTVLGPPKVTNCDPRKGHCEASVALCRIVRQCPNNKEKLEKGPSPPPKVN